MRTTRSKNNKVMQLNMGDGRSSVIVPMVAAALADGQQLVLVVVTKPQAKQMLETLIARLGGMLDKQVFHMPLSRGVTIEEAEAQTVHSILKECMDVGGILPAQPEHILSFKLMGIEKMIADSHVVGRSLVETQQFLNQSTRDIVDESDENFSVKFELVYTMGRQRPTDHRPDRWIVIQEVLEAARRCVPAGKQEFSDSIETYPGPRGSFPRTRILHQVGQERLLAGIVARLCETGLNGFPVTKKSESIRRAIGKYVSKADLTADETKDVEWDSIFSMGPPRETLLLLRGLVAGGILAFAFANKRWRVDYGLDPSRRPATRLAVPYRAKDNASPRSEFSHPDVVIVLTSLSYYYGGLSDANLFLAVKHLGESDQDEIEYQAWVRDADQLPPQFSQLGGINLEDPTQCTRDVFPCLRHGKSVIDYFLTHLVFPKEMREFRHKLSASGWDIGEKKSHPTTGFSGTNDSRVVLTLDVEQLDLQDQKHTNALVLDYLLQEENSAALMSQRRDSDKSDAEMLLAMVIEMVPPVRVILDVGAQVLELENVEMARRWLAMVPDDERTRAAVFFYENDQICVLGRDGSIEALCTSPFAAQLDLCMVFLDEVHTRGTDLKLPEDYRAAVTLGANLTKDRLFQACMKMRGLGQGQSVVFCVPHEIRMKIQKQKPASRSLDVSNILEWAISETWLDAKRSIPLWAVQGRRHRLHQALYQKANVYGALQLFREQALEFLEDEAPSLTKIYRPAVAKNKSEPGLARSQAHYDPIAQRARAFGPLDHGSALLREEQERELAPEIEHQREVQMPAPAVPLSHNVHDDVRSFVSTGVLKQPSHAYVPAFAGLSTMSAAQYFDVKRFTTGLLASADFTKTVMAGEDGYISDYYHRTVQLTLTGPRRSPGGEVQHMMVINPYEANKLWSDIKRSSHVALHLYAPRPNLGFQSLDNLSLYTIPKQPDNQIPPRLIIELNLFAGQLYFGSMQECESVCRYLGISMRGGDKSLSMEEFYIVECRTRFLNAFLFKVRRNCRSIKKTHLGRILDHRLLMPADF